MSPTGEGAGKTVACVNDLIRRAITDGKRDGRYAYIAPFRDQAKAVAWDYLKRFAAPIVVNRSESELWVELANGARIRLYGADNPDALRGQYLDGVVMDEVADMRPGVWGEILRPALSDRRGWAVFIGTPRGHDHFHATWQRARAQPDWFALELRADETGILPEDELADARRQMTPDQYAQEYLCSFEAAIIGAIYAKELDVARAEGRITTVPYDKTLPVDTAWDLGVGDATAIWFIQPQRGGVFRAIDYYEATGEGLPHYAKVLQDRGYTYGTHYAPHDIQVRELGSGKSRIDTARALGIKFVVAPQQAVEDGIHAVQMMFPSMWFDAERCAAGLEALQHYRREVNERLSDGAHTVLRPTPVHDWCFTGDTEVLTRYGTRQIMNLPTNGEVLTSCGWKRYVNPRITKKNARLVEVVFRNGYSVRCTPDHLFKTVNGWKSAESLTRDSQILSTWTPLLSISMGVYTALGLVKSIWRAAVKGFIDKFGVARLVRSLMDATFIIRMPTLSTTTLTISNACRQTSTCQIQLPIEQEKSRNVRRTGRLLETHFSQIQREKRLLSGIDLNLVGFGISATQNEQNHGRNGRERLGLVRFVEKALMLLIGKTGFLRSFAHKHAKPLRIDCVKHLSETEDVWCMTVPGVQEFSLANGALVHNCSHCADALRTYAQARRDKVPSQTPRPRAAASWMM